MSATGAVEEVPVVYVGDLLDAGDDAVVTLLAGETRLAAHKAVLAARSPFFAAKFQHDMLQGSSGPVTVADVEGPVLRHLLSYCYTLQAPHLPAMAAQLLAAADRYSLPALKDACEQQLVAQLAVDNAAAAAVLAVRHSCPGLAAAAVAFIRAHIYQVTATQGWADQLVNHRESMMEVKRLLADSPTETKEPATADGAATPGSHRQPDRQTPAAAATPSAPRDTPPPDDAAVSRLRSLSEQERGWRLVQAAKEGAVPELRALLAAGADVGARDWWGDRWTALHHAAQRGHKEAARCLVDGGADVDARNSSESTPLHTAAESGRAAVVELLLAASVDPNARNENGWTPLQLAAQRGHAAVVQLLVAASADPNIRDEDGWTPLHYEAKRGDAAVVQLLLAASADPNARDKKGRTPLYLAAERGDAAVVRLLVAASANPNTRDEKGSTPLHYAAQRGDAAVVQLLLAPSADPNVRNKNGRTPLHDAAFNDHAAVVQLLLAASADPNARNEEGQTPLHQAAWLGRAEVVAALLLGGADRSVRDVKGETPLDKVSYGTSKTKRVIELLRQ